MYGREGGRECCRHLIEKRADERRAGALRESSCTDGMLAGPSRGVIATFPLARAVLAHRAALCSSAGKAAEAPAPASAPSSEKRLHSSDIAFKPTTDGWGYSHVYGSGWDNIFKKKGNAKEPPPPSPPVPDPQQQQQQQLSVKLEALDKALGVGALSPALYEQARRELE